MTHIVLYRRARVVYCARRRTLRLLANVVRERTRKKIFSHKTVRTIHAYIIRTLGITCNCY